jgi:hypothetical protein
MSDTAAVEETTEPLAEGTSPSSEVSDPSAGTVAEPSASPAPAPEDGDTSPTLVQGGGEEDKPQAAPQNWPDNWRQIMAGGNDKALQALNRFNSPSNVFKSWESMRQKMSSGELVSSKPEGDEEALNAWRAQAGIPEAPEGYLEKMPDGLVVGEDDKPLIDDFLKSMHESDATPQHVHQALGWYYQTQEKLAAQQAEADKANRATSEDELRAEWGPDYRPNINSIHNLFNTHADSALLEKFFGARFPDGSPIGDDPATLKFLSQIANQLMPHGTITPMEGKTPIETINSRKGEIEKLMEDTHSEYWKGATSEALQQEYRDLIDQESRYK